MKRMPKTKRITEIVDFLQEHGDRITAEEAHSMYAIIEPKIRAILWEKLLENRRK